MNERIIKIFMAAILTAALSSLCGCYMHTKHEIEAHIVIDIRQIKEAAVNIEDMVSGGSAKTKEKPKEKKLKSGFLFFMDEAYAEELQLNYMTPEIESAVESRKARYSDIAELKYEGAIGENNKGLLEIKDKANLKSQEEVEKIVQGENKDREIIYWSIVKQNNLPQDSIDKVREAFASTQRDRASQGEWIQLPDGEWVKK